MNLDQHIHAVAPRDVSQFLGRLVVQGRHDQQNAVSAQRPGFNHLIRIKHEVFADLMSESLQEFTYEFNEEEFLKPLVERLSPRARHRLREAMARDQVVEELEPFWASFQPTPKALRITEIE